MAKFFYKDTPLIGLDISSSGIKMMSIDPRYWKVYGYGSFDIAPKNMRAAFSDHSSTVIPNGITELVKSKIIGSIKGSAVSVTIPTAQTYTRTFTLPSSAEKSLDEAIALEAEQYIPAAISGLYLDYQVVERKNNMLTILLSAADKTFVDTVTKEIQAAKLQPIIIEPSINAVGRLLTKTEDGSLPSIIVDISPTSTDIAIQDKGSIRVTGGVAIGGNTSTLKISEQLGVSLENAHQKKVIHGLNASDYQNQIRDAVASSLDEIIQEVKKVMRYYTERIAPDRKLEQLLIVGGGSNMPGIGDYFTEKLIMAARVASPWQKLNFGEIQEPARQIRARYITAAGAASIQPGAVWK